MKNKNIKWKVLGQYPLGTLSINEIGSNKRMCTLTFEDYNEKEEKEEIANHIVKCVNAHNELVKALEDILNHNMVNGNYADTCSAMMSIANNAIKKVNQSINET